MSDAPPPPDREATTDPSSGNTYYYNTKTNAVSWERPRAALGGAVGSLAVLCTGTVWHLCWVSRAAPRARAHAALAVE